MYTARLVTREAAAAVAAYLIWREVKRTKEAFALIRPALGPSRCYSTRGGLCLVHVRTVVRSHSRWYMTLLFSVNPMATFHNRNLYEL
jgi:hypothetical protein